MPDRLAEIRARLRAANESAKETWQHWPNLDGFLSLEPLPTVEQAALAACAPSDIAYLLDEVSMLRMDIAEIIRKADDTADWWKQEAEKWREHRD